MTINKLYELKNKIESNINNVKGKRKAQKTVENILKNLNISFAKAQRKTYTHYYIETDKKTGACRSLFIEYYTNGKVKNVTVW